MGLFNRFKNKEKENPINKDRINNGEGLKALDKKRIKILGTGCDKCDKQKKILSSILCDNNVEVAFEEVTDFLEIARYGVMSTPGLVIDEKVESVGKVVEKEALEELLKKANII